MNAPASEVSSQIAGDRLPWTLRDWIFPFLLAGVTFAVYWQVQSHEFINYDDPYYVTANPEIQKGITKEGLRWAFGRLAGDGTYWHPITWVSHMIDCRFFGLNAGAHHLVSAGIHALNVALLFLLLKRLTGAFWRSIMVAAVFAFHPLQVESVAWAAERKNVLSSLFFLLTIFAYTRYARSRKVFAASQKIKAHSGVWYATTLVLFAIGLMCKPMLVTLPCVLLLLDFWPLQRTDSFNLKTALRLLLEKTPLFLLSAISSFITIVSHKQLDLIASTEKFSWGARVANSIMAYGLYFWKAFWPTRLSVYYPVQKQWPVWQIVLSLFLIILVSFFAIQQCRKRPYFFMGWFWFLGTFVPVIGILQVGSQAMADRFIYIPIIGLTLALVWLCGEIAFANRKLTWAMASVGVIALMSCISLTAKQLSYWKNSETLFRHALAVTSNNYVAHVNLADVLKDRQQDDEAIRHFQEGLAIRPGLTEAHVGLGLIFDRKQMFEAAAEHYAAIVSNDPTNAVALNNLGAATSKMGKGGEALSHYSAAVKADPTYATARYNYASLLLQFNRRDEAIAQLQEVIRLQPDDPNARNNLGVALAGKGDFQNAAIHLRESVRLRPGDANTQFNLSYVLSNLGKLDEAKTHYDEALRLDPQLLEKKKRKAQ